MTATFTLLLAKLFGEDGEKAVERINVPDYRRYLAIVMLLLAGCATSGKRLDTLDDTLNRYESALRWGHWETALAMTRQEDEIVSRDQVEPLKHYRVTSYRELQRRVEPDAMAALVVAEIGYIDQQSNRVRTVVQHQQWRYYQKQQRWYLDGSLPRFR